MHTTMSPRTAQSTRAGLLRVSLAVLFVGAGVFKLAGASSMVVLFTTIGVGQWFRYAVGIAELLGAVLLVTPRLAGIGAIFLSGIMVGAIGTQLVIARALKVFVIHGIVVTASPLVPAGVLALLVLIAWTCRADTSEMLARARSALLPRSKRRHRGYEPS